jgi:hypothetical protein
MLQPYSITRAPAGGTDPSRYDYGDAVVVVEQGVPVPILPNHVTVEGTQILLENGLCERTTCNTSGGCGVCGGTPPCDSNPTIARPCTILISTDYTITPTMIEPPQPSPPIAPIPVLLASASAPAALNVFLAANPFSGPVVFHIYLITGPQSSPLYARKIAIPVPPTP